MEPMRKVSLDEILAAIPTQSQGVLDQKVRDIHLAEIAKAMTCWQSVCTYLGITEAEEAAIEGNIDVQRFVLMLTIVCSSLQCSTIFGSQALH